MRVGIVGYGHVGKALERLFSRSRSCEVYLFDKYLQGYADAHNLMQVNDCDLVFVAVPTPYNEEIEACDVSAVAEAVTIVRAPLCIKSTIPPGTTDLLAQKTGKKIAFSPEFIGESNRHPWPEATSCGFLIVGGDPEVCSLVKRAYESCSPEPLKVMQTDAKTAELAKYMGNCFLATKVAFVNQFFDLASMMDIEFAELRELFIMDPRVGTSHTEVTHDRGFGGSCLPKDLRGLVSWSKRGGGAPLLEAVAGYNAALRLRFDDLAPERFGTAG